MIGDEIVTNTSPTEVKLKLSTTSFYVRIRGVKAQITLSEEYGTDINIYTFTWGDEDAKSFTIRNQGKLGMDYCCLYTN